MNYMNPGSIPGMFNVPKSSSLPSSGHGMFQGFLEGEAIQQSRDFLDMAKAQQGQEFASNQLKNQIAWENKDAALQRPGLENEALKANTEHSKASTEQLRTTLERVKKADKYKNFEVAAAFAAPLAQAAQEGNQMKIRAILERYNYQGPQILDGFKPVQWDGSPQHLNEILGDWTQAQRLIQFDKEYMQKVGLAAEEGNIKSNLQKDQQEFLGTQYNKNRETELEAARIRASREGRGATSAEMQNQEFTEYVKILAKKTGKSFEEVYAEEYPKYRMAQYERTRQANDPAIVEKREEAGSKGRTAGPFKALKEASEGSKPQEAPNNYDEILKQKGLDPSKYDVRIENGRLKAYPK